MPLHLSRSAIAIAYSGGKIKIQSPKEFNRGEDPVKTKRIMDTDRNGDFIEYEVGMNESRKANLTVQNVSKDKRKILETLYTSKERFTLTLVDLKDATTITLTNCVMESRPEQQIVGTDDNFDINLSVIYVESKES